LSYLSFETITTKPGNTGIRKKELEEEKKGMAEGVKGFCSELWFQKIITHELKEVHPTFPLTVPL
jgi:hypothetical protein